MVKQINTFLAPPGIPAPASFLAGHDPTGGGMFAGMNGTKEAAK